MRGVGLSDGEGEEAVGSVGCASVGVGEGVGGLAASIDGDASCDVAAELLTDDALGADEDGAGL